jgi:hypothetical protein
MHPPNLALINLGEKKRISIDKRLSYWLFFKHKKIHMGSTMFKEVGKNAKSVNETKKYYKSFKTCQFKMCV